MYRGATGVGKTALALSLRPVVESDGGYFVHGKFDRRPEPHSVLISAFGEFAKAVVRRGPAEMARIRQAAAVVSGIDEAEREILVAITPALKKILLDGDHDSDQEEHQPETKEQVNDNVGGGTLGLFDCAPEASSEAINRFKQAVQKLVRVISSPDKPLVCLLDDFHWCDESSIHLFRSGGGGPVFSHAASYTPASCDKMHVIQAQAYKLDSLEGWISVQSEES